MQGVLMLRLLRRLLAFVRRPEAETLPTVRISGVSVDPTTCLAHEWCVHLCPQVFELRDGSARPTSDAASYFESHNAQILRAEAECPVEAIKVEKLGSERGVS